MGLRLVNRIMWSIWGAFLLSLGLFGIVRNPAILVFSTALMIAFIAFSLAKWRCPRCGRYLGLRAGRFCPYCRNRLEV